MRIIKSFDQFGIQCCFKNVDDCVEHFKLFLESSMIDDEMSYQILDISEDEYNKLPEFEGY